MGVAWSAMWFATRLGAKEDWETSLTELGPAVLVPGLSLLVGLEPMLRDS